MHLTHAQIDANLRTALRHTEPMVTGELDLLDQILTPDWVNHPVDFGEGPGPAGFKRKCQWLHAHFAFHFDHQDVSAANDKVWIRALVTGTIRGSFVGKHLPGQCVEFTTLECHRFVAGQIAESWHLQDYYALMVQVGVLPNLMNRQMDPYAAWR